jgi:flavin-dependent dehydrogenase
MLARAGRSVVVIEKSQYEQPRIGETLPPSARTCLARLAILEPFLAAGHLSSPGVLSVWGEDELHERHFIFNPHGPGWHLDRQRFDTMLIDAALEAGVRLCCGAEAGSCVALPGDGWQIQVTSRDGGPAPQLRARCVIDASGRAAAFARQQGSRRINTDRLVGLAAVLDVPSSSREGAGEDCGGCTLVEACADGWWYSALLPSGQLMAIHMTDADQVPCDRELRSVFWHARLQQTIHTEARLHGHDRHAVPRLVAAGSSRLDRAGGHGWLAVGDAATAFDPLSSQGLVHALTSGIRAGESLNRQLDGDGAAVGEYENEEDQVFREYLRLHKIFYSREQRWPHSAFWRRRHAVAA